MSEVETVFVQRICKWWPTAPSGGRQKSERPLFGFGKPCWLTSFLIINATVIIISIESEMPLFCFGILLCSSTVSCYPHVK